MGDLLAGKNVIVMGVANERSIAWAIAQSLAEQGARLAFTYESERVEGRVRKLAETIPGSLILPCNVTVDEEIDKLADTLRGNLACCMVSCTASRSLKAKTWRVNLPIRLARVLHWPTTLAFIRWWLCRSAWLRL